ncbi:MAG: hypothetical protein JST80_02650 [Bdellovibrionales bacterium]|nr:hypothetical protein [Bdellovibrionales bacterium]
MKTFILALFVLAATTSAHAAKYKCFASKYPTADEHFFADGYIILSITKTKANLKYYYVNTVAHQTTLDLDLNYKVGGVHGGSGAVKNMLVSSYTGGAKPFPGDQITTIYFDQALVKGNPESTGVVGQFTFTGHGYSYDWNICYNLVK